MPRTSHRKHRRTRQTNRVGEVQQDRQRKDTVPCTPEFRAKHIVRRELVSDLADGKGSKAKRWVNKTQVTLDWFFHHYKAITWSQHEAGTRFAEEVEYAGMYFLSQVNYANALGVDSGKWKGQDYTTKQLYHRERLKKIHAMVGGEMFNLLVDVCCFNRKMGEIEKSQTPKWPDGSGKVVLRMGLERLVEFYGV